MLDAYIIEDIKRQEEARRRAEEARRPRLHIDDLREPVRRPEIPDAEAPDEPSEDEEDEEPIRIEIGRGAYGFGRSRPRRFKAPPSTLVRPLSRPPTSAFPQFPRG